MNTQTLIYTEEDHKGQFQVVHAADCAEGKKAHGFASGYGRGDQRNWDRVDNATGRDELITELRNVYGDEEVEDYILPNIKWEPCVKVA